MTGILLGVIVGACLLFAVLAYRKKLENDDDDYADDGDDDDVSDGDSPCRLNDEFDELVTPNGRLMMKTTMITNAPNYLRCVTCVLKYVFW